MDSTLHNSLSVLGDYESFIPFLSHCVTHTHSQPLCFINSCNLYNLHIIMLCQNMIHSIVLQILSYPLIIHQRGLGLELHTMNHTLHNYIIYKVQSLCFRVKTGVLHIYIVYQKETNVLPIGGRVCQCCNNKGQAPNLLYSKCIYT